MSSPMKLLVKKEEKGYGLMLDDKLLHHVLEYKIESQHNGKYAELSMKMIVQYPVTQESNL